MAEKQDKSFMGMPYVLPNFSPASQPGQFQRLLNLQLASTHLNAIECLFRSEAAMLSDGSAVVGEVLLQNLASLAIPRKILQHVLTNFTAASWSIS